MSNIKASFKFIRKGNNKGDVIAILPNNLVTDNESWTDKIQDNQLLTYVLFDNDLVVRDKDYIKESRNANIKEYSATKNRIEKDFNLNLQVTARLKY